MKEEISIASFDKEKLKKLKDILESYQIKTVDINKEIKSDSKFIIEYGDKSPIILNKKFNFKIKLIRNKYYRQLLNLIDIKEDIDKEVDKYNSNVEKYNKSTIRFDSLDYLDKIDSVNYKDVLIMTLINYIGTYNFGNIFELTKEEMLKLKKYKNLNSNSEYITRLLGVFIPEDAKEEVLEALEPKIYGSKLDEMKKCRNFIIICPEIIQEFCVKYFEEFERCDINDIFELYTIIFNLVLVHEIGHGVFEYIVGFHNDETNANYFASLVFDGTFDKIIKKKTDIQDGAYKNPILITDKEKLEEIKKQIYSI